MKLEEETIGAVLNRLLPSGTKKIPIGSAKGNVGHTLETAGMAGLAAIQIATPPALIDVDVVLRLAVAGLAGVLAIVSDHVSPAVVLWILAAALVAQVVIELARHEHHAAMAGPF